jgi:protein gp37
VSDRSSIEWTGATWNPTTGCDRVSPGCENCYAAALSKRLKAMGSQKYQNDGDEKTSGPGFRLTVHAQTLSTPLKWKTPRLIFVNSMSDLFHENVPIEFIENVFDVVGQAHWHQFQLLTKRSKRLATVAPKLKWHPNLWIGTSVESRRYKFRIDQLRKVEDAKVRFLSLEPLLGDLGEINLKGIDWVIVGGESGPHCRQVSVEWIRSIRDQCVEQGVPFFFKQWGGRHPKDGGRDLDGRTWDEMPQI